MKFKFLILFFSAFFNLAFSQSGIHFETSKNKVIIPFQFINNLIFIPIKINDVELNFLLDTGVDETILLSLEDKGNVNLNTIEKIKLRGLGGQESIEALRSKNNILTLKGLIDSNHRMFIVLDQSFNFSNHIGIPVNGIIGFPFFENNLVEINYESKKIIIYKETKKSRRKINKNFTSIPISIENNKPYIESILTIENNLIPAKLLIDSGNSDAIWLFQYLDKNIIIPKINFEDFLGTGFSGDVMGQRARIQNFKIGAFEFSNPIIAIPDSNSIKSVSMVKNRLGSLGGDVLKRFTVVFDYKNKQIFLKKNSFFNLPFLYNKSGIEIQNEGIQWVQETFRVQTILKDDPFNENKSTNDFKYKFTLKPIYAISNVRKNSPAEICGLKKGDIIKTINELEAYKYSLPKLIEIMKSEENKWIKLEIERDGKSYNLKFQLINLL